MSHRGLATKVLCYGLTAAVAAITMVCAGCGGGGGGGSPSASKLSGTISGGLGAISGSSIVLYAGGTSARALGSATSGSDGSFSITYSRPDSGSILYAIASGGTPQGLMGPNSAISMLAVLGTPEERPAR